MKIQLVTLTAATILALSAVTAQANSMGPPPPSGGSVISNDSRNALAIGDSEGNGNGVFVTSSGGRAIAGSIYLTAGACDCDFESLTNVSRNAMAVGNATAGSIHISTAN